MDQVSLLRRHKAYALGLLIFLLLLWLVALRCQGAAWPYVKAFAEAGMVGGLADWFAVSALFRHPLGLKIPHTNLIEKSQRKIGENLARFVQQNFLQPEAIRPYLAKFNLSQYLLSQGNEAALVKKILHHAKGMLQQALQDSNSQEIEAFLAQKIKSFVQSKSSDFLLADLSEHALRQGWADTLLDYLCTEISQLILKHEDLIVDRVSDETFSFIPDFINQKIGKKIADGLVAYLMELKENPNHPVKKGIQQQLLAFAQQLHTVEGHAKFNALKQAFAQGENLPKISRKLWQETRAYVMAHLAEDHQAWEIKMESFLLGLWQQFRDNPAQQARVNDLVSEKVEQLLSKNGDVVQHLISDTIGRWESRSLSHKLELMVGKDLQFIRINGSLVGGLVGLLIYVLSEVIRH
jgi:uncharacterized membrane-anchored protein YjiN (DUF445 family)